MKPKDIIVGQKYGHKDFPNIIYLGCGRDCFGGLKFKNKCLVIIRDDYTNDSMVGFTVSGNKDFFTKFYPLVQN